jgi:cardiolipin synthase (CMP-forming)
VRFNRLGAYLGAVWIAAGALWSATAGEPLWAVWFVAVALVAAFVPGLANHVSLARAYLAAPAFAYALGGRLGAVAVVVALAGVTDLVDGTVARRFGQPSQLGGALDPVVDGVFMAGLVFGLAAGGTLPLWLGFVVVGRYALPAVVGGALLAVGMRLELRHTLTGQVSTVLILVLVGGVCLLRGLNQNSSGWLAGAEIVIPLVTVATFVHLAFAVRRPVAASREPG